MVLPVCCSNVYLHHFPSYMHCQYSSPHNTRHVLPAILWLPNFSMPTISMHISISTLLTSNSSMFLASACAQLINCFSKRKAVQFNIQHWKVICRARRPFAESSQGKQLHKHNIHDYAHWVAQRSTHRIWPQPFPQPAREYSDFS